MKFYPFEKKRGGGGRKSFSHRSTEGDGVHKKGNRFWVVLAWEL